MHSELNFVALADVQCLPDWIRQGELRLRAKPRSSVGLRLRFSLDTGLVQGCPPAPRYWNVRFSQTYSDHSWHCEDMLVNCPDNLGQQLTVDVFELPFAFGRSCAERRTSLARWPKCWRKTWEKYVTDVKPHRAAMSATVSAFSAPACAAQHRVGEVQAAGQDVPRDGYAIGGEDPGQLPLTDPDGRRDLFGAEAGIRSGAPLYRSVRRRGALSLEPRRVPRPAPRSGRARCSRRPARGPLVRVAWPGDSGQRPRVLVDLATVAEGRDDRRAERRYLGECRAVHLDDEFL